MSNIFGSYNAWIIVSLDNGIILKKVLFELTILIDRSVVRIGVIQQLWASYEWGENILTMIDNWTVTAAAVSGSCLWW